MTTIDKCNGCMQKRTYLKSGLDSEMEKVEHICNVDGLPITEICPLVKQ